MSRDEKQEAGSEEKLPDILRRRRELGDIDLPALTSERSGFRLGTRDVLSDAPRTMRPEKRRIETVEVADTVLQVPPHLLAEVRRQRAENGNPYFSPQFHIEMLDAEARSDIPEDKRLPFRVSSSADRLYIYSTIIRDPEYPDVNVQVCNVQFDETGRISKVQRTVTPDMLRVFLAQCPDCPFIRQLKAALRVGEPSQEDASRYEAMTQEAGKLQAAVQELEDVQQPIYNSLYQNEANTSQIHIVLQGEYAVTSKDKKRYLATFGAGPCYIVGMHCDGMGALTHIDATTDGLRTLEMMRGKMMGQALQSKKPIIILMQGGDRDSQKDVVEAYKLIKRWQEEGLPIEIRIGTVFRESYDEGGKSLAIDLESGECSQFEPLPQSNQEDMNLRMLMADIAARKNAHNGKRPARPHHPEN